MTRRISPNERNFLHMIANAGDSFCFGRDDKVTAEAHWLLRRMDRGGYVTVEETDDGPRVTITDLGRSEIAP